VRTCQKTYCLNHDPGAPYSCREYGSSQVGGARCGGFVSAGSLMRTFSPGCHRTARGRWVSDKATVFR
jgi:hypothetical protein